MSAVYIISEKGKISKESEHLVFKNIDGVSNSIFLHNLEMLVAMGKISFTGEAVSLLAKNRIPLIFTSASGIFNSKMTYKEDKNCFLRLKQYQLLQDEKKSLEVAKEIVRGKIKNQISFMQRIKRKNQVEEEKVLEAISQVKNLLADVDNCETVESLRGKEGCAAKSYFEVFRFNLIPEWAVFESRSKRPPKSNVNAVLSFLYSLLSYRVETALESYSLDCAMGNLHEMTYGKSPLVYDLMEEFRTPFVDTVCCSLFNLGILCTDDFEEYESESEEKGIYLSEEGRKKAIAAFEQKMNSCLQYEKEDDRITVMEIIFRQAKKYRRFVDGETDCYEPYYAK